MSTIEKLIETFDDKLQSIGVPGTPFDLSDYIYGRCHIFALALQEELGYEMEFLWDTDYWFDGEDFPSKVLIHAYCILPKGKEFKGKYLDARGLVSKRMIELEYDWNTRCYELTSKEQLKEIINNLVLEAPEIGEIQAIRKFIRENRHIYI